MMNTPDIMLITVLVTITIAVQLLLLVNNKLNNQQNQRKFTQIDLNLKSILDFQNEITKSIVDNFVNQSQQLQVQQTSISQNVQSILIAQQDGIARLYNQLSQNYTLTETKLETIRSVIEDKLNKIQIDNQEKLEKIRLTVEEKLHHTLENRLGESFKIVTERLEMVHRGLGEMQNLASGVQDLKKVLSNVKTRGIWGEVQLSKILAQLLTSEQFIENAQIKDGSGERVEYAVKLPGKDKTVPYILLPIDAKFPIEDYQRLVHAQDKNNIADIELYTKAMENSIKKSAKLISDKYVNPPYTTDFAIMFLPIEGLYAEVLRNPGLVENIQNNYRVMITSPSTLSAILNSLQMGFKTLAIEKRTSEIWKAFEAVRSEFIKFTDMLTKTRLKLEQAGQSIVDAETRSRLLNNKLKHLELHQDNNDINDNIVNSI